MACPHVAVVTALWWEALRKSGAMRPAASLVMANLLTRARTTFSLPSRLGRSGQWHRNGSVNARGLRNYVPLPPMPILNSMAIWRRVAA